MGYPIVSFHLIPFWPLGVKVWDGPPAHWGAAAEEPAIIARMQEVYHDYPRALRLGKRASDRMLNNYTWRQAAEKFIEICRRYA